jgi:hypothetical protein
VNRKKNATMILESSLLTELIDAYQYQQYQSFTNAPEIRSEIWAKARAAKEIQLFIENKCKDIVDAK